MKLKNAICEHILSDFGINSNKNKIISDNYKSSAFIKFEDDGKVVKRNIYAIKSNVENRSIKVYIVDMSLEVKEYSLIIEVDDLPIYGINYYRNFYQDNYSDIFSKIATSLDKKTWIECNTFLQATFLAGMENIKNLNVSWEKLDITKNEEEILHSFIEYSNNS